MKGENMIINCRHICVIVKDLELAIEYYTEVLDLKISHSRLESNNYIYTLLGIDKLHYTKLTTQDDKIPVLELYWFPEDSNYKPTFTDSSLHHISFTVENIGDIYNKLNRLSYVKKYITKPLSRPTLDPIKQNYVMFSRDTSGNLIEFVEPIKKD